MFYLDRRGRVRAPLASRPHSATQANKKARLPLLTGLPNLSTILAQKCFPVKRPRPLDRPLLSHVQDVIEQVLVPSP